MNPGRHELDLKDAWGRVTTALVEVPPGRGPYGVLLLLHGAGASAERMLDYLPAFCRREGLVQVAPVAQILPDEALNQDWFTGAIEQRFRQPAWSYEPGGFPLTALWKIATLLPIDLDRVILMGMSMGGMATWNLGMRCWQHFAAIIPMGGALSRWERFGPDPRTRWLLPNLCHTPVYAIHGERDDQLPARLDRENVADLRAAGAVEIQFREIPDAPHVFALPEDGAESQDLQAWLRWRRRGAWPETITHRCLNNSHGRAGWLQIDALSSDRGEARLSWNGARLRVEATGIARLTAFVQADRASVGQAVEVQVGSRTQTQTVVPCPPDQQPDPRLRFPGALHIQIEA